jgi:type IV pilus assembly protein PilQ
LTYQRQSQHGCRRRSAWQRHLASENIPWDQALDIILEARDLGMRKIGNVVIIDLKKNLDEREQRALEAQNKIKELEPLRTEFYRD